MQLDDQMIRPCWVKNLGTETFTMKADPQFEAAIKAVGITSPVMSVNPGSIVLYPHWYILPVTGSGRPGNWIRGFSRESLIELDVKMRHDTHERLNVKSVEKEAGLNKPLLLSQ